MKFLNKSYTDDDVKRQAESLRNKVLKTYKHLAPKFKKRGVEAFRLYEWDIPEIRAVVDIYGDHLLFGEYVRTQTEHIPWAEAMAHAVAEGLGIQPTHVHIRRRQTRPKDGPRYQRLANSNQRYPIVENELSFLVNFDDFLDVGLFLDHRETRALVKDMSAGLRFLNLFAYTGSFTVYAAAGKAAELTTVDISDAYIDWAKANLMHNFPVLAAPCTWEARDVFAFIEEAAQKKKLWDLIVLDPPSFSTRKNAPDFDIAQDHPLLIERVSRLLSPKGTLLFSSNHQRFEPRFSTLNGLQSEEITRLTLPIDFKDKMPHRCFRFTKA